MNDTAGLIMRALGWQGGTIHQVAQAIGCDTGELIGAYPVHSGAMDSAFSLGWFAARTCARKYLDEKLRPLHAGDLQFWLGVAAGQACKDRIGADE